MTHLDLFSGIGGFAIAAQACGYTMPTRKLCRETQSFRCSQVPSPTSQVSGEAGDAPSGCKCEDFRGDYRSSVRSHGGRAHGEADGDRLSFRQQGRAHKCMEKPFCALDCESDDNLGGQSKRRLSKADGLRPCGDMRRQAHRPIRHGNTAKAGNLFRTIARQPSLARHRRCGARFHLSDFPIAFLSSFNNNTTKCNAAQLI